MQRCALHRQFCALQNLCIIGARTLLVRRWQRAEVCCCIVAFQCCCCPLLAAGHHECWSLNGQNRLGAHEWPGGGSHLVVLLHQQPPAFRSSVSQAALCLLLLLLLLLLPQQPFLAVRRGIERAADAPRAPGHDRPLWVGAGAALCGGRLVARLCSAGDPPQQRVAEQAGKAGGKDTQATPSQPPGSRTYEKI